MSSLNTLERLAFHVVNRKELSSPAAARAARLCVSDAIACSAAGVRSPSHQLAQTALSGVFSDSGEASVWFNNRRAGLFEAAYLNSLAVSADDLDDGSRPAVGHPGGAIVPAVISYAEATGYGGDLLRPITVGYEVAVSIATARTAERLTTMATGRWAAYGVAAAISTINGDAPDRLAHALGHAGSLSPQLVHPHPSRPDGLKEGTPWAVLAGLMAHRIAVAGIDSPTHILDADPDFDPVRLGADTAPAVASTYFKRYACCRWIHPALDLIFELKSLGHLDPRTIERVEVRTFARSFTLPNERHPSTLESAHYSFPYCVALAILGTPTDFLPLTPAALARPDVLRMAELVHLVEDPQLTRAFPGRTPVEVLIRTTSGAVTRSLPTATGDPAQPFANAILAAKHAYLLRDHEAALPLVARIRDGSGSLDISDLYPLLVSRTESRGIPA